MNLYRKSTLKDVAELAGVSTATVSHVLNDSKFVGDALKLKVLAAVDTLDYVPNSLAKSLRMSESKLIGLMISDISNPFFSLVVRGIEDGLAKSDYNVLLCNTDSTFSKEEEYLKVLLSRRIDGLVVSSAGGEGNHFRSTGVPLVFLNRSPNSLANNMVTTNNYKGAYWATEHLVKHGYQRIAIIAGPQHINTARDRLMGYCCAIGDNGGVPDDGLLKIGQFDTESGYTAMQELMGQKVKPDAVFTCNNLMTLGAFRYLREAGLKIPEQIALVGYDDPEWATIAEPPLTVIRQPAYNLGLTAAKLVVECIKEKNQGKPQKIFLDPELIVRKSCGCNGGGA